MICDLFIYLNVLRFRLLVVRINIRIILIWSEIAKIAVEVELMEKKT